MSTLFQCHGTAGKICSLFLHAEFISAWKTKPKAMVFEKYAKKKNRKKYLSLFSISCGFLPCFLDGKKPNIAKLVYINF